MQSSVLRSRATRKYPRVVQAAQRLHSIMHFSREAPIAHVPPSSCHRSCSHIISPTMTSRKHQMAEPISHPAPWTLKGEMYWLIANLPAPLPANVYNPLEQQALTEPAANDFQGGLCYMQVVRYSDSPVGPYDELAMVPGVFKVPGGKLKGKKKMRVSRIYVSGKETIYDGKSDQRRSSFVSS